MPTLQNSKLATQYRAATPSMFKFVNYNNVKYLTSFPTKINTDVKIKTWICWIKWPPPQSVLRCWCIRTKTHLTLLCGLYSICCSFWPGFVWFGPDWQWHRCEVASRPSLRPYSGALLQDIFNALFQRKMNGWVDRWMAWTN